MGDPPALSGIEGSVVEGAGRPCCLNLLYVFQ